MHDLKFSKTSVSSSATTNNDTMGNDSGSRTDEESLLTSDDDDIDDDDERREERTTDDDLLRTTDDDDAGGLAQAKHPFSLSPTKRKVGEHETMMGFTGMFIFTFWFLLFLNRHLWQANNNSDIFEQISIIFCFPVFVYLPYCQLIFSGINMKTCVLCSFFLSLFVCLSTYIHCCSFCFSV